MFLPPIVVQVSLEQVSYVGEEQNGDVEVCAILTGELGRQITLELIPLTDTADTSDFSSSILAYTFTPTSDSIVCSAVGISNDSVVEDRERFTVELQENPEDRAVVIVQNSAEVFIDDNSVDCK